MNDRFDIHQAITDKIIAAIEAGAGDFVMPWHRQKNGLLPKNIFSGNFYRGINILALWVEAHASGRSSNVWGTYRQWAQQGAQVRKGAKAAHVVFYKEITRKTDLDDKEDAGKTLFARATPVFNADQVEGWVDPDNTKIPSMLTELERNEQVEQLIAGSGAAIVHGGNRACYNIASDTIYMPEPGSFFGSSTSSPTEAYYSTLAHELTHWTGIKTRCDRDLTGRFGSQAYAMEELVAELGAAYLCAELGVSLEPRDDHAQYIASWLAVLRGDNRAVFTAASAASKAATFLYHRQ